jgi:hypothetical protein
MQADTDHEIIIQVVHLLLQQVPHMFGIALIIETYGDDRLEFSIMRQR